MQNRQCNNEIETGKAICLDEQISAVESRNIQIGDNVTTVLADLCGNKSDNFSNGDIPNFTAVSKTSGSSNKSYSLRKSNPRKCLSLLGLNNKFASASPKSIQAIRKTNQEHLKKPHKSLKSGKHISLDTISLQAGIFKDSLGIESETYKEVDKHQSGKESSNIESLRWLILNVSNLDYNGFELNDPTALMPNHFDAYNPTESGRNSR